MVHVGPIMLLQLTSCAPEQLACVDEGSNVHASFAPSAGTCPRPCPFPTCSCLRWQKWPQSQNDVRQEKNSETVLMQPYFHPQSFCIIPRHATFREPIPSSRVSGLCQFCFVLIASVLSFCTLLIMSLWQFSRLGFWLQQENYVSRIQYRGVCDKFRMSVPVMGVRQRLQLLAARHRHMQCRSSLFVLV